jgi:hypothetical protein
MSEDKKLRDILYGKDGPLCAWPGCNKKGKHSTGFSFLCKNHFLKFEQDIREFAKGE